MPGERDINRTFDAVQTIDVAIQRTRSMLFEPFLYSKWLNCGVMIFLSVLGGGGGLTNLASPFMNLIGTNLQGTYQNVEAYVLERLSTIVVLAFPIMAMLGIITAALMYVGARGTMMVIRTVANDDEDIGANWGAVGGPAWTYFVFHLEMAIAVTVYWIVAAAVAFILIRQQLLADSPEPGLMIGTAVVIAVTVLVSILYGLAMFAMRNFIAPLLYQFKYSALEAWSEFFAIARANPAQMVLFLLIKVVYSMVMGVAHSLSTYCTCCIGALPVINQTLLAPLHIFERSYSLYALASLGPEYAIIQAPLAPEPPMLPPDIAAPPPPDINHEIE